MIATLKDAEPRVVLDLSVDEFVAFYAMYYIRGDGSTSLRGEMEKSLEAIVRDAEGTVIGKAIKALQSDHDQPRGLYSRVERALQRARS